MGEGREYITKAEEGGNVQISEDVIATIAAMSAAEIEGCNLAGNLGSDIAGLLGRKNAGRGVKVRMAEGNVTVDVAILVSYGFPIQDVARQVQDAVYRGLDDMAGLSVSAVNVHVSGILFVKEKRRQQQEQGK